MKLSKIKTVSATKNSFIGRFKAHDVSVARSIPGDDWSFMVMRDGMDVAVGEANGELSQREAVHFAIRAAKLIRDEKA